MRQRPSRAETVISEDGERRLRAVLRHKPRLTLSQRDHDRSGMLSGIPLSTLVRPRSGEVRPYVLVVDRSSDRRLFLRTSLRRRCRVMATASTGKEGIARLRRCSPCGVVLGGLSEEDRDAFRTVFSAGGRPAVLKLWATRPPSGWVDAALRHPFTRADLIRAVDQLLSGETTEKAEEGEVGTRPESPDTKR